MAAKENTKKVVNALIKTIKNKKLYGEKSQAVDKFLEESYEILVDFLRKFGPLSIIISENNLIIQDEIVYSDDNKITSLPLYLYRNGIRSITFLEDISKNELSRFLSIISTHDLSGESSLLDDLWEENFDNILYYIIDRPLKDYSWVLEGNTNLTADNLYIQPINVEYNLDENLSELIQKIKGPVTTSPPAVLNELMEEERENSLLHTLFSLMSLEKKMDRAIEIVRVLKSYTDNAIKEGNINVIYKISNRLMEENNDEFKEYREYFNEIIESTLSDEALSLYTTCILENTSKERTHKCLNLLLKGERRATPFAEKILAFSDDPEVLHGVKEMLQSIGKHHPEIVIHLLNPAKIKNFKIALEIIEYLKDPSFLPHLEKYIEEPKLTKLVLKPLFSILPREKLFNYIDSPNDYLRLQAYRYIKNLENEDEMNYFLNKVRSKDFYSLYPEEQENILRILSTMHSYEVIDTFNSILKKFTFNKYIIAIKRKLIYYLAKINTEDAWKTINKYKKSRKLKNTVREVLRKYGKK